jgi:hypothetical protein
MGSLAVDHFARLRRATKAPARDSQPVESALAVRGSELFDKIGRASCQVETLTAAPAGAKSTAERLRFLPHSGQKHFTHTTIFYCTSRNRREIVMAMQEHYGRRVS